MLENIEEISLLLDFYGELLPQRQREYLKLYHEENYSLAEIAEEYGVSRQSVHDSIKKAQNSLNTYEQKLALVRRLLAGNKIISGMDEALASLIEEYKDNKTLVEKLNKIRLLADELGE